MRRLERRDTALSQDTDVKEQLPVLHFVQRMRFPVVHSLPHHPLLSASPLSLHRVPNFYLRDRKRKDSSVQQASLKFDAHPSWNYGDECGYPVSFQCPLRISGIVSVSANRALLRGYLTKSARPAVAL
ncbi:hypothetical protein EVAR_77537_1 [Eumeta japonica]|uniref:Uncharacterized protein n=1 Tax=Eumeta variegata TaxID=151549 RepID=A0A4C1T9F3_EUMVA|nr:hypothetical protein EVAR_77537_1 [Eumeta japonica]